MRTSTSLRWLVVAVSAAMLLAVAAACSSETIEVPGETVVVEKEVIKEVQVPGETVVVEKEVVKTVEVPGETVTKEVVKTVEVPGETVVVEKEVVKTVEVPGETVVVEKEVVKTVEKVVVQQVPVESERYTRNIHGKLVEMPQYGGEVAIPNTGEVGYNTDPCFYGASWNMSLVLQGLGMPDWGTPREEYPFEIEFVPMEYVQGSLAENWEQPDLLTYIFNIRKGVQWHDKAPMNGREFNAYDVEYTWHRLLGSSDKYGFTEPCPSNPGVPIESVTATDESTVVFTTSSFTFDTIQKLVAHRWTYSGQPREVVEQYGDLKDWKTVVGTGPYELTDLVEGSAWVYTKNPNYWKYDENHPENRLPYVDEVSVLIMPDFSTRMAAMRTGKIALLWGESMPIDLVDSLQRTNPELIMIPTAGPFSQGMWPNVGKKPFSDIRVRRAMQMALDLPTIVATYFKGYADATPQGMTGANVIGYMVPFEQWPEEIKGYFRYAPEAAEKRCLMRLEYPRGADGIRLKTRLNQ